MRFTDAQAQIINQRIDVRLQDAAPAPAPSTTAVWRLPIGRRYHNVYLQTSGSAGGALVLTDIPEIRAQVNGKVVQRYSAVQLDAMNTFKGRLAWNLSTNPVLTIPFDRYALENSLAEQETALDTGPIAEGQSGRRVRTLSIEADFGAGTPTDIAIIPWAEQSLPLGFGAGQILHIRKDTRNGATGENEFFDLPFNSVEAQRLDTVFIGYSANDISEVEIFRDTRSIFRRSKIVNTTIQTDGVRVPQSGYFVIDRTEKGMAGNGIDLEGVQDFRYRCQLTGAATITFLSHYLGAVGE